MPISAFGFFAAIAVAINYLEAILIMPCYFIIYEKYIKYRFRYNCLRKCKRNKKVKKSRKQSIDDEENTKATSINN